jgi:hypothetical protein
MTILVMPKPESRPAHRDPESCSCGACWDYTYERLKVQIEAIRRKHGIEEELTPEDKEQFRVLLVGR